MRSIDDNETVVGIPGRVVRKKSSEIDTFDFYAASSSGTTNDPTLQAVNSIIERLAEMDEKMAKLTPDTKIHNVEKK